MPDLMHLDQLREQGALPGIRDEHTLEAVLTRPQRRWRDEPASDLATLTAAYRWGIATSHPCRDGNRRIASLAMVIFLGLNGQELDAPEPEVVTVMLAVASGHGSHAELASWIPSHLAAQA